MNQNNIFSNPQNAQNLPKNPSAANAFLVPNPQETKIIAPIPELKLFKKKKIRIFQTISYFSQMIKAVKIIIKA